MDSDSGRTMVEARENGDRVAAFHHERERERESAKSMIGGDAVIGRERGRQ